MGQLALQLLLKLLTLQFIAFNVAVSLFFRLNPNFLSAQGKRI
jgi:hypothetical protein